jgi:hypothetical protein
LEKKEKINPNPRGNGKFGVEGRDKRERGGFMSFYIEWK